MSGSRTPMDIVTPRRRTRRQVEEHVLNLYREMKRKNEENGSSGSGNKKGRSRVNSETVSVDGDSGHQYSFTNDENSDGKKSILENDQSSGMKSGVRMTRNGVKKSTEKREGERQNDDVASSSRGLMSKEKLGVDDSGGIECLGEQDVSKGSSVEIGRESWDRSKDRKDVGGDCGGKSRIEPLHTNESDESSDSFMESDSESSDEDDDSEGDEDYDGHEMLTSSDSEQDTYCSDDFVKEKRKNDCCSDVNDDGDSRKEKEEDLGCNMVDDAKRSFNQQKDSVIILDENEEAPSVRKNSRIHRQRKEIIADENKDEGHRDTGKCYSDRKEENDLIFIREVEKILHRNVNSSATSEDKANKDRTGSDSIPDCNLTKEIDNGFSASCLKKRKIDGLEILVDLGGNAIDTNKRKIRGLEIFVDFDDNNNNNNNKEYTHKVACSQLCSKPKFQGNKLNDCGKSNSPIAISDGDESSEDEREEELNLVGGGSKAGKKRPHGRGNYDSVEILMNSIASLRDGSSPVIESTQWGLPQRFRFEDEVKPPEEKSEREIEIDSLFQELEFSLRQSEDDNDNLSRTKNDDISSTEMDKSRRGEYQPILSPTEMDESPEACCHRGEHQPILDEQIGVKCKYCLALILDIKYVLPDFYIPPPSRQERKDFDIPPSFSITEMHFSGSTAQTSNWATRVRGTTWELIGGFPRSFFHHQCEGFEFMWKNIAGSIDIEKLKGPLSGVGKGCIISHAPGTGKTRLTLVFLESFLKLYPSSRVMVVAPKGLLPNWVAEIRRWKVDVPFHNLNDPELSGNENEAALRSLERGIRINLDCIRLVKLYSWMRGGSVLGISYTLFEKLTRIQGYEVLQTSPSLLVLDEGHIPRNHHSRQYKALVKVVTKRCIILSGTPFQNSCRELWNTLRLINPEVIKQTPRKWKQLSYPVDKNEVDDVVEELRALLEPVVHKYDGRILQESLPGLKETIVVLNPTDFQKTILLLAMSEPNFLDKTYLVSLVSVHPSLVAKRPNSRFSVHKDKLEEIMSDAEAGVKLKFVLNLILLADALGERVLVFSLHIETLVFIKNQLKTRFSWHEGKQVLQVDGTCQVERRQQCISAINDPSSEAKVLLAGERACSEGINLIGVSRVVLLDTVWNPSIERQAIGRAYRIGQKKVVYVYRLILSETEARQYEFQSKKDLMSEMLFSPMDGQTCGKEAHPVVSEDKILEAMQNQEKFRNCIANIVHNPRESDEMIDEAKLWVRRP